jgi:hypothetical protein
MSYSKQMLETVDCGLSMVQCINRQWKCSWKIISCWLNICFLFKNDIDDQHIVTVFAYYMHVHVSTTILSRSSLEEELQKPVYIICMSFLWVQQHIDIHVHNECIAWFTVKSSKGPETFYLPSGIARIMNERWTSDEHTLNERYTHTKRAVKAHTKRAVKAAEWAVNAC